MVIIRNISAVVDRHRYASLAIVTLALVLLAWSNRFVQDDAFISYRYAERLSQGDGLTWNDGERIEGYTNFLWTLALSGAISLGGDPVSVSLALGLLSFCASLVFTYRLGLLLFDSPSLSLLAISMLGTNYTFSSYATGGLETQFVTALGVGMAWLVSMSLVANHWPTKRMFAIGLIGAAMILTRPDSILTTGALLAVAVVFFIRPTEAGRRSTIGLLALALPLFLCLGTWLIWKWTYYGALLPNSFFVKVVPETSLMRGVRYLYRFTDSYLLYPLVFVSILSVRKLREHGSVPLITISALVTLWLLYIVAVGGDFMEFRFMVPILPFIMLWWTWMLFAYVRNSYFRFALFLLLPGGSLYHAVTFQYSQTDGIESISQLSKHVSDPEEQWMRIGQILGEAFGESTDVVIATTASGVIPYYSRLTTIDMLGINDRWVAEHGQFFAETPGHSRISPLKYLLDRKVNLVLAHPLVIGTSEPITKLPMPPGELEVEMPDAAVIEIPLDDDYRLIVLYPIANRYVEEAIVRLNWRKHVLTRR